MRIDDVVAATNRLIRQHFQVTVRQVYYQIYPKFHSHYKNARSFYSSFDKMLVKARERGIVRINRVIDTARNTMGGDFGCTDPDEFLQGRIDNLLNAPDSYHRPKWENQQITPVIWIEKDALSRIVHSVARKFNVMTYPSRGYSSMHFLHKIAGQDVKILHFADHDPSGLDMTHDLRKRISKYSNNEIPIERIALTHKQVKKYNLSKCLACDLLDDVLLNFSSEIDMFLKKAEIF